MTTLKPCGRFLLVLLLSSALSTGLQAQSGETVIAVLETTLGDIEVEVFVDKAPHSAGSFLRFLDDGRYKGGGFYRVVRPDNDNGEPTITVIQGGLLDTSALNVDDLVPHETTDQTGIKHTVQLPPGFTSIR